MLISALFLCQLDLCVALVAKIPDVLQTVILGHRILDVLQTAILGHKIPDVLDQPLLLLKEQQHSKLSFKETA
jgi:hypothetical protein